MEEKDKKEVEIDLLELGQKLWDNKRFVIKVTIIGAIVGLIIAFSIPKKYTTSVIFTIGSNQSSTGTMGALASLAGINLTNVQSSEIISPELYPDIMNSTTFVQGTFDIEIKDKVEGIDTTLYGYLKHYQKSAWWNSVLKAPAKVVGFFKSSNEMISNDGESGANRYFVSDEEIGIIGAIRESYSIETDKKTSISKFEVSMQSPAVSAFLADTLTRYLQSYIIQERTKKAKTDLNNTQRLYEQSKADYEAKQDLLASFLDRNKNIISARYGVNQKKLENDVSLAYSVYTQMSQQYQLAQIKVQDDTPVFTIIQPAIEPTQASSPNKKLILFGFVFLSLVSSSLWILRKDIKDIMFS